MSVEVKGLGIDIAPIARIARLVERYDRETLNLLFTPGEIDRCQSSSHPHRSFAVCFATKEAVGKALGTGLAGIGWNEIEANLTQDTEEGEREKGKGKRDNSNTFPPCPLPLAPNPQRGYRVPHSPFAIHLHGDASIQAKRWGIQTWLATWCHWDEHVLVHVLAL